MVVRIKPCGSYLSLSPGMMNFATTPTMKPTRIVQRMHPTAPVLNRELGTSEIVCDRSHQSCLDTDQIRFRVYVAEFPSALHNAPISALDDRRGAIWIRHVGIAVVPASILA